MARLPFKSFGSSTPEWDEWFASERGKQIDYEDEDDVDDVDFDSMEDKDES